MNPFHPTLWMRFVYAIKGLGAAVRSEISLQLQLGMACLAIAAGCYFNLSRIEWGLLILVSAAVLTAELLNTAIEKTLDRLAPDWHPETGKIKDIAAAAVFLISCAALLIGLLLFAPHIYSLLGS